MISCIFSTYLCIYVIMGNEYKDGELLQNASEFYGSVVSKPVAYVFLSLFLVMLLGGEVFCAYLIALHTLLHRKRISTFDLITYRRQLEQMKIIASMQRQN